MNPLRLKPQTIKNQDGSTFALIEHANLALTRPTASRIAPPAPRMVFWSGWFGDNAERLGGVFPRDFRAWTPAGWAAFEESCEAWMAALAPANVEFVLRPHARHIVSDVQSSLAFLRKRPAARLLLDPASLFTGSMLPQAEDHLARIFETLGGHPATAAVLLANVQRIDPEDPDALAPTPLHEGLLDPSLLMKAWKSHCPATLPCVLLSTHFDEQARILAHA